MGQKELSREATTTDHVGENRDALTLCNDPEESFAAEVPLPTETNALRVACGDERVQGAAARLGQGSDADGENIRLVLRSDEPRTSRPSSFPPDSQQQLALNGISDLLLPALIVRFYQGWVPDDVKRPAAVIAVRVLASGFTWPRSSASIPKTWKRSILYMPFVMAVGIGPIRAAMPRPWSKAIFEVKSISRDAEIPMTARTAHGRKNSTASRRDWLPYLEIGSRHLFRPRTIVYLHPGMKLSHAHTWTCSSGAFSTTGVMSVGGWIERLRFWSAASSSLGSSPRRLRRARVISVSHWLSPPQAGILPMHSGALPTGRKRRSSGRRLQSEKKRQRKKGRNVVCFYRSAMRGTGEQAKFLL